MQTYLPLPRNVCRDVTRLSRTPALGGNKKLVIYITLQTISLLDTFLRGSVNRGWDINAFLL
jgi:hypothetical protein